MPPSGQEDKRSPAERSTGFLAGVVKGQDWRQSFAVGKMRFGDYLAFSELAFPELPRPPPESLTLSKRQFALEEWATERAYGLQMGSFKNQRWAKVWQLLSKAE